MRNNAPKITVRRRLRRLFLLALEGVMGAGIFLFILYVANPENGFTQTELWLSLAFFAALPLWMLLVMGTLWWFTQPSEGKEPLLPSPSGEEW